MDHKKLVEAQGATAPGKTVVTASAESLTQTVPAQRMPGKTALAAGNQAMRQGNYKAAAGFYRGGLEDIEDGSELQKNVLFNLRLAERKACVADSSVTTDVKFNPASPTLCTSLNQSENLILYEQAYNRLLNNFSNSGLADWKKASLPCQKIQQIFPNEEQMLRSFGAAFLGPLLAFYFSSLLERIRNTSIKSINFLAREGFFLEQVFDKFLKATPLSIKSRYLLVSRVLLFKISLVKPRLRGKSLIHSYKGSLFDLLVQRYGFTPKEINFIMSTSQKIKDNMPVHIELPLDQDIVEGMLKDAEKAFDSICSPKLSLFLRYLKDIGFGASKEEHLSDIGYSGTIQSLLSDITGIPTTGHYFVTTKRAIDDELSRFYGHILNGVNFGDGVLLLDRSLLIECILTAPHGSVIDIWESNDIVRFVFGLETVAQHRIYELQKIIDGATDYAIVAHQENVIMEKGELLDYYAKFLSDLRHFPRSVRHFFEIDDATSGVDIANPLCLFLAGY